MREHTPLHIVISSVVLLVSVPDALANDGYYAGDGATIRPAQTTHVQLAGESVVVTMWGPDESSPGNRRMKWRVDATLHFRNLGEPTTVLMGFPFGPQINVYPGKSERHRDYWDPHFRTWVDGEETATTIMGALPDAGLHRPEGETVYTFPVAFASDQVRTVRHRYWAGGYASSPGQSDFSYILTTGALWAGHIDTAVVRVIFPQKEANQVDVVCPHEHDSWREGEQIVLEWRWQDLEPDFDLTVRSFPRALHEMALDELTAGTQRYWRGYSFGSVFDDERPNPCEVRWFCNRTLAEYGYPFHTAFVRAQFYQDGKLKEDPTYSESSLEPRHRQFLEFLTSNEWAHD